MPFFRLISTIAFLGFSLISLAAEPDTGALNDPPSKDEFIRLDLSKNGKPTALKTPFIQLQGIYNGRNVAIDLIGVIHYADQRYYDELNESFKKYDTVLYEMVLPKDIKPVFTKDMKRKELKASDINSPLVALSYAQQLFGRLLQMADQLEAIDYSANNMKHSDINTEELKEAVLTQESPIDIFEQVATSFLKGGSQNDLTWGAALLFSRNRQKTLRRIVATELYDTFSTEGIGLGQQSIILVRNDAVIKDLTKELDSGTSKIAVFYGAAHLPDLSEKIHKILLVRQKEIQWLDAWRL